MTILQEFRLWARRAPVGERVLAMVASLTVLAAVAWLLVPAAQGNASSIVTGGGQAIGSTGLSPSGGQATITGGTNTSTLTSGGGLPTSNGSGPGPTNVDTAPGASNGGGGQGQSAGPTSGGAGGPEQRPGGCAPPPGSDQGVTANQINISVVLINLAGEASNSVAGTPSPQQEQNDFQQVIASINAAGGIACRKVVATYYAPNIADQSQLQQTCLQIVQSKPFAAIDLGAFSFYPSVAACLPSHQIPEFSGLPLPRSSQSQFYPYWFSLGGIADTYHRNAVFALAQRGFFSAADGFTKLGLAYRDCTPEFITEVRGWLAQVGVPPSKIVEFDDGCSSTGVTPPNVTEQAVLTFNSAHASHVMFIDDVATFTGGFTEIAAQQGFHPKYGFPDDGEVATSSGSGPVNWQNLNGAIAIADGSYGEETTPGLTPNAASLACNAIYAKGGEPAVYQSPDGIGGVVCDDMWMVQAAVDHAPVLQRNALAAGLQASRSVPFSYPEGPNTFGGYHSTGGGEFWRPLEAVASCQCWHVLNPTFAPSFS